MMDNSSLNLAELEKRHNLPQGLLNAVMMAESAGNPNAVSPKGAQGLFQFMPATAQQYNVDPFNPNQSAEGAARYYSDLLKANNGNLDAAIASYNFGPGNVDAGRPLPQETQDYISKVKSGMGASLESDSSLPPGFVLDGADQQEPVSAELPEGFVLDSEQPTQSTLPKSVPVENIAAQQQKPLSFLAEMGQNAAHGIQSIKDLRSGNYEDFGRIVPSPKTEALGQKLFPEGSEGSFMDALRNLGNTSSSDWSGALLEKLGQSPEGKALAAIGGIHPVFNAAGTAISRYVNPVIEEQTGIHPDNLQLLELAAGTGAFKAAPKINDPLAVVPTKIKTGVQHVLSGLKARSGDELSNIAANKKSTAGAIRAQMQNVGAVLSKEKTSELNSNIAEALKDTKLIPEFTPKTAAVLKYIKTTAKQNKGQISLNDLDQYRRLLRKARDEDTVASSSVRKALDNIVNSLTPEDFSKGGPEAVKYLNDFRKQYTQASKFDDVASILEKADGDPNKIRSGLTRFMQNKDNLRGWTESEKAALKKAAKDGSAEWILKGLGRFGWEPNNIFMPTAGAALAGAGAGAPGALGLAALGTLARQARKYSARGQAESLLRTIEGQQKANPMYSLGAPVSSGLLGGSQQQALNPYYLKLLQANQ